MVKPLKQMVEEFWLSVKKGSPEECWNWTGYCMPKKGYGRIWDGEKPIYTHRLAYELANGPIPAGQAIDHLCSNTSCTNPAHLRVVGAKENNLRRDLRKALRKKRK